MKQLVLSLLLCCLPGLLLAQRSGNVITQAAAPGPGSPPLEQPYSCFEQLSTYQLRADSILQALDKTQIPSRILYDRTAGKAWLDVFGNSYNNADTSSVNHFLQSYYELRAATYNEPGTLPCRRLLADNASSRQRRDTVLLGALRYRFHTLDPQAVSDNLLRWDNATTPPRLLDVAGRSRSPYQLREVAVAAALADSTRNGLVHFRLDPVSIFTNTGAALSSASITFDDGGPARTCTPGQVLSVSYTAVGHKVLRYVLTYSDGTQFTTYSHLYVPKAACLNCRGQNFVEPCYLAHLTANITHLGIKGEAQVSYFFSTNPMKSCNKTAQPITKPVIIVDGIDYEGTREGGDIFGEYLKYQDGSQTRNLGRQLQNEGHDVVILDFPNVEAWVSVGRNRYRTITRRSGADYMERNAYTLVKLIQNINQQLPAGSTEQIVVVGPSMGGQISRFALAYMEKRYNDPNDAVAYQNPLWRHNTRLFVSLDSPNNGATIPIGFQHFVRIFAEGTEEERLVKGLGQLNSPAARQLALQHHTQGTYALPDPLRTTFVNTLNGLGGYPRQLRRIAVTNGALDGYRQRDQNGRVIQAGDQALLLEQQGIPSTGYSGGIVPLLWMTSRVIPVTTASARLFYAPEYGQVGRVARTYLIKPGEHHGERTPEATGLPNSCSLDAAPGGYRFFWDFANNRYRADDPLQNLTYYSVRDKACFIPTLSGLGYTQAADHCQAAGQNLVCAGTTAFDAYYGPTGQNEDHIQLTPANVEFMRNEILKRTPIPVFTTAPAALCPNSGATAFSVRTECVATRAGQAQPGTTYTWSSPSGLQIVSGQGSATVMVQPVVGFTGTATLQVIATRTGYTASTPVPVSLYVGSGYITLDGPGGSECYSRNLSYSATSVHTQHNYVWNVYLNNVLQNGYITQNHGDNIIVRPTSAGNLTVTVTDTDLCSPGQPMTASRTMTIISQMPGSPPYYIPTNCPIEEERAAAAQPVAYPNPANAEITVRLPATETAAPGLVALYNHRGELLRQWHSTAAELKVSTAGLPQGLYFLTTQRGQQMERTQLRIEHGGRP